MQTKRHSLLESITNIMIGYTVALIRQLIIFPHYGINIPMADNLLIGAWFTIISIIRSYSIRRWYNRKTIRLMSKQSPETKQGNHHV